MTNKNLSLALLLLVGMLLGYTSCTSRNPETSSQSQHTATTSSQNQPGAAEARTTVTVEEALPDELIARVTNSDLQRCLRELRENPSKIDDPIIIQRMGDTEEYITALQLAALEQNALEVVKGLLKAGANLNTKDVSGQAALHYAITGSNLEVVKALVVAKADLNQPNKHGTTPLHWAVQVANGARWDGRQMRREAILELLAQQPGIDFNKKNNNGLTPLDIAKTYSNPCIADILKNNGATQ